MLDVAVTAHVDEPGLGDPTPCGVGEGVCIEGDIRRRVMVGMQRHILSGIWNSESRRIIGEQGSPGVVCGGEYGNCERAGQG